LKLDDKKKQGSPRNQIYAGTVDVTEYGVRGERGDFKPPISEDLFYRAQAVLSSRLPSTPPKQRAHLISLYAHSCVTSVAKPASPAGMRL
jgi:hypothetical protein